jgi:hypothetical protein
MTGANVSKIDANGNFCCRRFAPLCSTSPLECQAPKLKNQPMKIERAPFP